MGGGGGGGVGVLNNLQCALKSVDGLDQVRCERSIHYRPRPKRLVIGRLSI